MIKFGLSLRSGAGCTRIDFGSTFKLFVRVPSDPLFVVYTVANGGRVWASVSSKSHTRFRLLAELAC